MITIYTGKPRDKKILKQGDYKNYHFIIVTYGTHPCAYVKVNGKLKDKDRDFFEDNISCHGCITYYENTHWFTDEEELYIGWDYAHVDDCLKIGKEDFSIKGKKWTVPEIEEEVQGVIEQLVELEGE